MNHGNFLRSLVKRGCYLHRPPPAPRTRQYLVIGNECQPRMHPAQQSRNQSKNRPQITRMNTDNSSSKIKALGNSLSSVVLGNRLAPSVAPQLYPSVPIRAISGQKSVSFRPQIMHSPTSCASCSSGCFPIFFHHEGHEGVCMIGHRMPGTQGAKRKTPCSH